jgi:1-acyl-sn-glycerol-3-phosphate acyltransferase
MSPFHSIANRIAALGMKYLFGYSARVHVLRAENANGAGGFLLASNHIGHFDPFIISSVVRRKIDWMAMAEFFPLPIVGFFLRAVDAFPAARDRADRRTIQTAIERLRKQRIVGIFPEGGIRDGARSLLEGAPLRPGAATLAHMARVPILPCVIVGSDRLYAAKNWLPFRRVPVWIAFGNPISHFPDLDKKTARETIEWELAAAFKNLYAELRQKFALTADDLPHPPRERMKCSRPALSRRSGLAHQNTATERRGYNKLRRFSSGTADALMCASMNLLQSRHRLPQRGREEMERYVIECEKYTAQTYYAAPNNGDLAGKIDDHHAQTITWRSPIESKSPANNTARVDLFPCARGWEAPTVLMLHALMSATRVGYRRWAAHFNDLGWNACFVHLPYHYSRVPRGYWNGELAITADLIRNAEGLRQGVVEIRQLLAELRTHGCNEFGILGTSYGGWIGALLAIVERDFRFVALMGPIVNVEHAIWESPASAFMRRELRRRNIEPQLVARHFHLSSPLHNEPMCDPSRILFVSGDFDIIARPADIESIHQKWRGSELLRVPQGHFGYRMFRDTVEHLETRGL